MDINIAVVPVAGLGTRLLPATKSQPKEMLPAGRKPVVQYVVEELTRVGLERILFITGPGKTSIENHFDVNSELIQTLRETGKEELLAELSFERTPAQYFFTRQRQLLGLGHAVACAQPFVGNHPFVVALGDSIIGLNAQSNIARRLMHCFEEKDAAAVIAFQEVPDAQVSLYGVAKPKGGFQSFGSDQIFEVEDLIEKPTQEEAPSNLAIAARYVFAPTIFAAIEQVHPDADGEIQLTEAIRLTIQGGGKVYGLRLRPEEERYDIGSFDSYFRTFVAFALADEKYGPLLRHYMETLSYDHHS